MSAPSDTVIRTYDTPDVLAMMRPEFYEPITYTDFMAYRHCAIVAFLACAHIDAGTQLHIELDHWRPQGEDVVLVTRWGKTQKVPLTPQLIFVVERFIAERERVRCRGGSPRWESKYLFVTEKGRKLGKGNVYHLFSLRMKGPKPKSVLGALLRFCARNIRAGSSSDVQRFFCGFAKKRGSQVIPLPDVPLKEMTRIVIETNPFKDLDREVRGQVAAQKYLSKNRPAVTLQQPGRAKLMPVDHPLVASLLKVKWPRGREKQAALRAELRLQHGAAFEELLRTRIITGKHLAELLRTTLGAALTYQKAHFGPESDGKVARRPRPKHQKPATAEELATLSSLRAQSWPRNKELAAGLSQDLLVKHYAAVDPLVTRNLMTVGQLAKLFRASPGRLFLLRAALRHGVSVAEVPIGLNRERCNLPPEWWDRIRKEAAKSGREANISLYFRMVKAGFTGNFDTFKGFMTTLQRRNTALSEAETQVVETLSAVVVPDDPVAAEAQREQMLLEHFVTMSTIVATKRMAIREARKLLGVGMHRFAFITAAMEAGLSLTQALRKDFTEVPAEMWSVVGAEHAKTPEEPPRSFYFRMRLLHDFPGSERLLAMFRYRLTQASPTASAA